MLVPLYYSQVEPVATVVTVSGQTIAYNDTAAPWSAYAHLKVATDGNVYEGEGTSATPSYVQIDTGTDWIRPTAANDGLYEVRATIISGSVTGTTGSWLTLDTDRVWYVNETVDGSATTASFTIEIRYNGGAVLDSATYTLQASCNL